MISIAENYGLMNVLFKEVEMKKKCSQCKKIQSINDFSEGYKTCKKCRVYHNNYQNTEKYKKERYKKLLKRYHEDEKFRQKRISESKTKRAKDYNRYYREKNKEKIAIRSKEYYEKNKEKNLKRAWQYRKKRLKNDPYFKFICSLRSRISSTFKRKTKRSSIITLLGCPVEIAVKHLEKQFTDGMTWDNYGQWHIDHISPLSSFNLEEEQDLKKACHYTNLQPLWAKDNRRKGTKTPIQWAQENGRLF